MTAHHPHKAVATDPDKPQSAVRDTDPNVLQRRASDPSQSVWVAASAGTGKTKVLTDRVLRLLLPRPDGTPGTPPHRILCLTFTKAAANEMLLRVGKILGEWAVISEEELTKDLHALCGRAPDPVMIAAARRLFSTVIDAPGGLKIMTIHSFCQSVLSRFPVEANLPPQFKVIDEAPARLLMNDARDQVITHARHHPDDPAGQALYALAAVMNEEQFAYAIQDLCRERTYLQSDLSAPETIHKNLCELHDIAPSDMPQTIIRQGCAAGMYNEAGLYAACKALAGGSAKSDQPKGRAIQQWLEFGLEERIAGFDSYAGLFLKKDGDIYKKLVTKGVADAAPESAIVLHNEAMRLKAVQDKVKAAQIAALTRDLFMIGKAIYSRYDALKDRRGQLDYDDLIMRTKALLSQDGIAPWVLFKLDGGLDHILVDEAQDTSPEQWDIIQALCDDFFSGESARDDGRTLFVVGDKKQSIYSFQRADPEEFDRRRDYFKQRAAAKEESLRISFRSTASVLRLVDEVFRPADVRDGVEDGEMIHISHRSGQAGSVTLWPLSLPDDAPPDTPWEPPVQPVGQRSASARLAEKIGTDIASWIGTETLESYGRTVRAGDILVLVQTRTAFVNQLVRALKTRNVPVSGIDRMVLGDQIAVMDMLALARFALLPADDLSLACALKSPLAGWDEERLYDAARGRTGSLWDSVRQQGTPDNTEAYLDSLIKEAKTARPYDFFSHILQRPCPAHDTSGLAAIRARLGDDALDPLDEFLNSCLQYEADHIPTLQGFMVWQQEGDITIKREQEEAGDSVRIMTVHGAKGLQAPIVILPDTLKEANSKKIPRLLWPDKTGYKAPLWAPRKDMQTDLFTAMQARLVAARDKEYKRLLYVALTRAEDKLYITGYKGRNAPSEDSWYYYVQRAMEAMPDVEITQDDGEADERSLRLSNPQIKAPDRTPQSAGHDDDVIAPLQPCFYSSPAPEPVPSRPLAPSRPAIQAPALQSPLDDRAHRFLRGNMTHKLLQILPDLPDSQRREAAEKIIASPASALPRAMAEEIVTEVFAILDHPAYGALFSGDAYAEVALSGMVGGALVNARIDRLCITDHEIMIVDYKTNRPPPSDPERIPPVYLEQMKAYRDIVAKIYPARRVRTFLLWTDGAQIVEIADDTKTEGRS